jgi:hypothetical protein
MGMSAKSNTQHIPERRIVEIAKDTGADFTDKEREHVASCDGCRQLLTTLRSLEQYEY